MVVEVIGEPGGGWKSGRKFLEKAARKFAAIEGHTLQVDRERGFERVF